MTTRSVMAEGDYLLLTQHATWKLTTKRVPYLRVFARVVAYYTISQAGETAHYEAIRVPRSVNIFLDTMKGRGHINILMLRAVGWQGEDVRTAGEDSARGVLFRANCAHKAGSGDRKDEVFEDWRVVLWERHWGDDQSDPLAESKAQDMLDDALSDMADRL